MTLNNVVLAVAFVVATGWVFGSVSMMQRNYMLQKQLDDKSRQQQLAELELQSLQFQKRYYQSTEYQELAARENLGLASPGEKVFTLPPNTQAAKEVDANPTQAAPTVVQQSNFQQWVNFLFGGNAAEVRDE